MSPEQPGSKAEMHIRSGYGHLNFLVSVRWGYRHLNLLLVASLLLVPKTAMAQKGGGEASGQAETEVGATASEDDSVMDSPEFAEAKAYFKQGEALYAQEKYDAALAEFEKAYALLADHPKRYFVLYNMGMCHEKLNRFESAGEYYRLYLEEGGEDAEDRAAVEKALQDLDTRASRIDREFGEAKQHVEQGERLFQAGDYNAALAEFEKAYDLLEGHPNRVLVLYNVGMCHEKLFRYDLALKYYHRYLDETGKDAEDRAAVEATLRALESLLGSLQISTNIKAEVWIDDRMMGTAPGKVFVPGGRHMMELRASGYESVKVEVQLTSRESQRLSYILDEIVEYEGISPFYFWTGTALTAAALGTGAVFGVQALSEDGKGRDRIDDMGRFGNITEQEDEVKSLALKADILFGAAALLAVGTTVIFFITDWGASEETQSETDAQEKPRASVAPVVTEETLGLSLGGGF